MERESTSNSYPSPRKGASLSFESNRPSSTKGYGGYISGMTQGTRALFNSPSKGLKSKISLRPQEHSLLMHDSASTWGVEIDIDEGSQCGDDKSEETDTTKQEVSRPTLFRTPSISSDDISIDTDNSSPRTTRPKRKGRKKNDDGGVDTDNRALQFSVALPPDKRNMFKTELEHVLSPCKVVATMESEYCGHKSLGDLSKDEASMSEILRPRKRSEEQTDPFANIPLEEEEEEEEEGEEEAGEEEDLPQLPNGALQDSLSVYSDHGDDAHPSSPQHERPLDDNHVYPSAHTCDEKVLEGDRSQVQSEATLHEELQGVRSQSPSRSKNERERRTKKTTSPSKKSSPSRESSRSRQSSPSKNTGPSKHLSVGDSSKDRSLNSSRRGKDRRSSQDVSGSQHGGSRRRSTVSHSRSQERSSSSARDLSNSQYRKPEQNESSPRKKAMPARVRKSGEDQLKRSRRSSVDNSQLRKSSDRDRKTSKPRDGRSSTRGEKSSTSKQKSSKKSSSSRRSKDLDTDNESVYSSTSHLKRAQKSSSSRRSKDDGLQACLDDVAKSTEPSRRRKHRGDSDNKSVQSSRSYRNSSRGRGLGSRSASARRRSMGQHGKCDDESSVLSRSNRNAPPPTTKMRAPRILNDSDSDDSSRNSGRRRRSHSSRPARAATETRRRASDTGATSSLRLKHSKKSSDDGSVTSAYSRRNRSRGPNRSQREIVQMRQQGSRQQRKHDLSDGETSLSSHSGRGKALPRRHVETNDDDVSVGSISSRRSGRKDLRFLRDEFSNDNSKELGQEESSQPSRKVSRNNSLVLRALAKMRGKVTSNTTPTPAESDHVRPTQESAESRATGSENAPDMSSGDREKASSAPRFTRIVKRGFIGT